MIKKIAILMTSLTIASCASVSEVIKINENTYTVSASMSGSFPSWSEVKQLALKRAIKKCESIGRGTEVIKYETHGVRGWTPLDAELTFKCTGKT